MRTATPIAHILSGAVLIFAAIIYFDKVRPNDTQSITFAAIVLSIGAALVAFNFGGLLQTRSEDSCG